MIIFVVAMSSYCCLVLVQLGRAVNWTQQVADTVGDYDVLQSTEQDAVGASPHQ
jgi:hypothetical protein